MQYIVHCIYDNQYILFLEIYSICYFYVLISLWKAVTPVCILKKESKKEKRKQERENYLKNKKKCESN